MEKIRLGKTNLMVTKNGFGALPVQRRSMDDGVKLLRLAYMGGINYFDTARMYYKKAIIESPKMLIYHIHLSI